MKKIFFSLLAAACALTANAQLTTGEVILQNVETGTWLSPGNDWGTQASLAPSSRKWVLGGTEGAYTLESTVSNGGQNYYLSGTYCDGASTPYTITQVSGNTYTIMNAGGKYLQNSGTTGKWNWNIVNVDGTDATATSAQWNIYNMADLQAMASTETPVEMSWKVKGNGFGRNEREANAWTCTGYGTTNAAANYNPSGGTNSTGDQFRCAESWRSSNGFDLKQTISGLPKGKYKMRAHAAMNNYNNATENLPVVYANDGSTTFVNLTNGEASMAAVANAFLKENKYLTEWFEFNVTDGTAVIGFKGPRSDIWNIMGSVEIQYMGIPGLDAYQAELDAIVATAKGLTAPMNKDVKAALAEAITTYEGASYSEVDDYNSAISAVQTAINNANASIAVYVQIAAINIASLTESGQAACVVTAKYEAGEYETLAEAEADFRLAVLAQTEDGADFTGAIINPDFSTGNINGWTDTFTAGNHGYQANNHYDNTDDGEDAHCNQFMECWVAQPGHLANGKLSQVLKNLPAGNYTLTADVNSCQQSGQIAIEDLTGVYIFATCAAGTFRSEACATADGKPKTFSFTFNTTAGDCEIGLMTENTNCNWVAFDNCRLVRNGASTVNVYQEALKEIVAEATDPATYDEVEASSAAKAAYTAAYNAAVTTSTTDGLTDEAYLEAGNALAEAKAALEASVAGYAASKSLRDAITAGTNVATYADNGEAFAKDWTLDHADGNFHFNTWSTEGESDGTEMGKNFNEYWHGKEAPLADGVISHTTLVGLPAGNYAVSVLVRAYNENGGEISGVKFNDIDITTETATAVKFNALDGVYGVITDVITVAEDGNLDFGFTVESATFNWLSWKGLTIKYLGEETSDATVAMSITSAGYGTFCAPFAVKCPYWDHAYTITGAEGNTLTLTEVTGVIPANTPVVLEGTPTSLDFNGVDYATVRNLTKGMLTGVLVDTNITEGYVLQNQTKGVGFYEVQGSKAIKANRAYLTAPAGARFFGFDAEETAINAIDALTDGKAQIFDLNGRKLNSLQKGINIVNGVKILVK